MKITTDKKLVAYCGLYCGACKSFIKGKCAGCSENDKLSWCKIRGCNIEHGYQNCVECTSESFENCKLRHNFMSGFFALVFGSDRDACIVRIRDAGAEAFAAEMAQKGEMALKRNRGKA